MLRFQKILVLISLLCGFGVLSARPADEFKKTVGECFFSPKIPLNADVVVLDLNPLKPKDSYDSEEEEAAALARSQYAVRRMTFPTSNKYRFFVIDFTSVSQFKKTTDVVALFKGCAKKSYQVAESTVVCIKEPRNLKNNRFIQEIADGLQALHSFEKGKSSCCIDSTELAIKNLVTARKKEIEGYSAWVAKHRDLSLDGKPYVEEDKTVAVAGGNAALYALASAVAACDEEAEDERVDAAEPDIKVEPVAAEARLNLVIPPPVVPGGGSGVGVAAPHGAHMANPAIVPAVTPPSAAVVVGHVLFGGSPAGHAVARRQEAVPSPARGGAVILQTEIAKKHFDLLKPWLQTRKISPVAYYCSSRNPGPQKLEAVEGAQPLLVVYLSSESFKNRNIYESCLSKVMTDARQRLLVFVCGFETVDQLYAQAENKRIRDKYRAFVRGILVRSDGSIHLEQVTHDQDQIPKYLALPQFTRPEKELSQERAQLALVVHPVAAASALEESCGGAGVSDDSSAKNGSSKRVRCSEDQTTFTRPPVQDDVVDLVSDDEAGVVVKKEPGCSGSQKRRVVEMLGVAAALHGVVASQVPEEGLCDLRKQATITEICGSLREFSEEYSVRRIANIDELAMLRENTAKKVVFVPLSVCASIDGLKNLESALIDGGAASSSSASALPVHPGFQSEHCVLVLFDDLVSSAVLKVPAALLHRTLGKAGAYVLTSFQSEDDLYAKILKQLLK